MMGGRGEGIFNGAVTCWIVLSSLLLIRGFQSALVAADLPAWSLLLGFVAAIVVARSVIRGSERESSPASRGPVWLARLERYGLGVVAAVVGGSALATTLAMAGLPAAGLAVGFSTVAMTALMLLIGNYVRLERPVAAGKALTIVAGAAWFAEGIQPGLYGSSLAIGIATLALVLVAGAFFALDGDRRRISLTKSVLRIRIGSRLAGRLLSATISIIAYMLLSLFSFTVAQAAGWYGTLPASLVQGIDPTTVEPSFLTAAFGSVLTQIGLEIVIRRYFRAMRAPSVPSSPRRSLILATGRRLGTVLTSVLRAP